MQIDTRKLKKLIIKAVPYVAFSYVGNLIGFAYRTAEGDGFQEKILPFMSNLGVAFARIFPSLHPFDLLFGLVLAGVMRLVLYVKSKNRKKFRQGEEYGSAVWGTQKDIEPYMDLSCPENNVILTKTESLTMGKPSAPKFARNKNILVIGGSGSGKTRFFVKPNIMQANCSYVITDPKGEICQAVGGLLRNDHRLGESIQSVLAGLFLNDGKCIINDLLCDALLAVKHDAVDQLADQNTVINRIGQDFSLGNVTSSGHYTSLLHYEMISKVLEHIFSVRCALRSIIINI